MKYNKTYLRFNGLMRIAVLIALILLAGCKVRKEVRQAVASTNQAIVDLLVEQPGLDNANKTIAQSDGWRESVEQLEQIIANNPGQDVLVNQLRFRQAWILTVYGQDNLAELKWKEVDPELLATERDSQLYANREGFSWWYAHDDAFIEEDQEATVEGYIKTLGSSVESISDHDLDVYFATVRALMALQLAAGADSAVPGDMEEAKSLLETSLADYHGVFTAEELSWLNSGSGRLDLNTMTIPDARNRYYLCVVTDQYKTQAEVLMSDAMPAPDWHESWIDALDPDCPAEY